jgi:hypothetical protein
VLNSANLGDGRSIHLFFVPQEEKEQLTATFLHNCFTKLNIMKSSTPMSQYFLVLSNICHVNEKRSKIKIKKKVRLGGPSGHSSVDS